MWMRGKLSCSRRRLRRRMAWERVRWRPGALLRRPLALLQKKVFRMPQDIAGKPHKNQRPRGKRDVHEHLRQEAEEVEAHRLDHLVRAGRIHAQGKYRAP